LCSSSKGRNGRAAPYNVGRRPTGKDKRSIAPELNAAARVKSPGLKPYVSKGEGVRGKSWGRKVDVNNGQQKPRLRPGSAVRGGPHQTPPEGIKGGAGRGNKLGVFDLGIQKPASKRGVGPTV